MLQSQVLDIRIGRSRVTIDRNVFEMLFENSPVAHYADIGHALDEGVMSFQTLVELARKARIPYVLFFAPAKFASSQLERNERELLKGVNKETFSLNSRDSVRITDVQNIIKDLTRKQEELKKRDVTLQPNRIVGLLRNSRDSVRGQAQDLATSLAFDLHEFRSQRTKKDALDLLIGKLEACQILVSQSQSSVMPQRLPKNGAFSGICLKDTKIPYLFTAGANDGPKFQPAGRRILTLTLLLVLAARGNFSVVAVNHHAGTPIDAIEWRIAEEFLLPANDVQVEWGADLESLVEGAEATKVTPSALAMRLQRLGHIDRDAAVGFLRQLERQFQNVKQVGRTPLTHNAVRKYASAEYVSRMFRQLDQGRITHSDFRLVVTLNCLTQAQLGELRGSL